MTDPKPYASPVCYASETDPAYAGYLTPDEVLALLAEAHRKVARDDGRPALRYEIETIITRLGGTIPTPADHVSPADTRTTAPLRAALPKVADNEVYRVLKKVLDGPK